MRHPDDQIQPTHKSKHYESCLNSTCSRSSSPIRRELWEPKHAPPPQKVTESKKSGLRLFRSRQQDESSFIQRIDGSNQKGNRKPLFTYSVKEGSLDKGVEVKIQHSSPPTSPRSKTLDPQVQQPSIPFTGNLTLELELNPSKGNPIVNISPPHRARVVQFSSNSSSTCCLGVAPKRVSNLICQRWPCQTPRAVDSCDSSVCQPCPTPCRCACPCLSNTPGSEANTTVSPTSPQETVSCDASCEPCHCFKSKEDKATSPIKPRSRSPSPDRAQITIQTPHHSRTNSTCSVDNVDIQSGDTHAVVDCEGGVRQLNVDLPIGNVQPSSCCTDDHIQCYDPQLEVFYTSSCNQSKSQSPRFSRTTTSARCRTRSPSPSSDRFRSPRPPWNNCPHIDNSCPSSKHSTCSSPWRDSPSRSRSRSPPKSPSTRALSRNNSVGSLDIYGRDGELSTSLDWEYDPKSDVDTHTTSGTVHRFGNDCQIESQQIPLADRSVTPIVTLNPRGVGRGQVTIQWGYPSSHTRCEEVEIRSNTNLKVCRYDPTLEENEESNPWVSHHDSHSAQQVAYEESRPSSSRSIVRVYRDSTSPQPRSISPRSKEQSCSGTCPKCCCGCCYKETEGLNKCPSLPPHLQSEWSSNLRCPPTQLRTKPILYRDSDGHEHIMFADGTVEDLSYHSRASSPSPPPSPPPQPLPKPPPPSNPPCDHQFTEEGNLDHEESLSNPTSQNLLHQERKPDQYCPHFSPRCGDIVIRAHQGLPCRHPRKDNGQVAFFSSEYDNLQQGDSIVRLGEFDCCGKWLSLEVVEMYMLGTIGRWMFLGTHEGHECFTPLEANQHQIVRSPNKDLKPRLGDLIIHTIPDRNSFYFWNPRIKLDSNYSHLLLRAYIGHPRVVDENHTLACCVPGHLPVGYAELYVKVKGTWLFLGRDDHMFTEEELNHF